MIVADGGLATTLQRDGLPPFTPVDDWLSARPDAVVAAHRAFVDAGAAIVLAATFRTLPHLAGDWAARADRAVALARRGAGDRAAVFASIGPASTPARRWRPGDPAPWGALVAHLADRVDGFVLETFTDVEEAVAAVADARTHAGVRPVIASLVPDERGRTLGGDAAASSLRRLAEAGADGVGFNCGGAPAEVARAIDAAGDVGVPLWAKPAGGDDAAALLGALRHLATRCRWVGGCCGVGPEAIAAFARGRSPRPGAPGTSSGT